MFAFCELAMSLLKAINLTYPSEILIRDMVIIVAYCFLETVRVVLGRKSSLADRGNYEGRGAKSMGIKVFDRDDV